MNKSFGVFLPIDKVSKSKDSETSNITVSGWASTPDQDLQGETIDSHGINADYLISDGWVDYEHDRDIVIGFPTENSFVDSNKGLFLEAELFGNDPHVQEIIKLYNNIKEAGANRNLGFSIEGKVEERDGADESIIRKVNITGVAVTKNPANTEATWEVLQKSILNDKSLEAGHGISPSTQTDGAAFRTESLSTSLISLARNLDGLDNTGLQSVGSTVAQVLDDRGITDDTTLATFLQLFSGLSKQEALTIVNTKDLTDSTLSKLLGSGEDATDDD